MAFGKKNVVSENLSDYSLILLGESGIGKTTTLYEVAEKEFGEDGYLLLNTGKEDGVSTIDGVNYEDVENWKKFEAVVNDIVKNKKTEYPSLKVVIVDTLDQLIDVAEPEAIERWNRDNIGKKDFIKAKTLNSSYGGFGRGEDAVIQMILELVWKLKKVGVQTWYTAHTKSREVLDAVSNQTYTTLSTNMMQKYFNGFKTKVHVVGVACIDRTIETEKTGRKNIVTKKEVTVNRVKEERRKIVFRDDNYSVDSKSRFADIVDEIPLDSDELINALKDAIKKSKGKRGGTHAKPVVKKEEPKVEEVEEDILEDVLEESTEYPTDLLEVTKDLYKNCKDKDLRKEVLNTVKQYGKFDDLDQDTLVEIYDKLSQ